MARRSLSSIFGLPERRSLDDIFTTGYKSPFDPEEMARRRREEMEAMGAIPAEQVNAEPEGMLGRYAERYVSAQMKPTVASGTLEGFKQFAPFPLRAAVKGGLQVAEGLGGLAELGAGAIHPRIEQLLEKPVSALARTREAVTREREKGDVFSRLASVREARGPEEVAESLVQLPMMIMEQVPQFALTLAGGAVGVGTWGTAFMQEAGHAYLEEKEKGEADLSARLTAAAVGTANAFLERLAPESLIHGAGSDLVKRLFHIGLTEGGTEGVQEAVQMLGSMANGIQDGRFQSWAEAFKKEWNTRRLLASGFMGLFVGGTVGLGGTAEGTFGGDIAAPRQVRAGLGPEYVQEVLTIAGPGNPGLESSPGRIVWRNQEGAPVAAVFHKPDNVVTDLAVDLRNLGGRSAMEAIVQEIHARDLVQPDEQYMSDAARHMAERLKGRLGKRILEARVNPQQAQADQALLEQVNQVSFPSPAIEPMPRPEGMAPPPSETPPPAAPPPPPQPNLKDYEEYVEENVASTTKHRRSLKEILTDWSRELFSSEQSLEDLDRSLVFAADDARAVHQHSINPIIQGVYEQVGDKMVQVAPPLIDRPSLPKRLLRRWRGARSNAILSGVDPTQFRALVMAQRDLELAARGKPGTKPEDSMGAIQDLKNKLGPKGFQDLEDRTALWRDWMVKANLDPLVRLGLITPEDRSRMLAKGEFFSPMQKVLEVLDREGIGTEDLSLFTQEAPPKGLLLRAQEGVAGFFKRKQRPEDTGPRVSSGGKKILQPEGKILHPLHSSFGSYQIRDPIEESMNRAVAVQRYVHRMAPAQALARWAEQNPDLALEHGIVEMDRQAAPVAVATLRELGMSTEQAEAAAAVFDETGEGIDPDEPQVVWRPSKNQPRGTWFHYENGEKIFHTAEPGLLGELNDMGLPELHLFSKLVLAPIARLARAGFVLPVTFLYKNLFRDQVTAFTYSPGGIGEGYIPVYSFGKAIAHWAGDSGLWEEFIATGAGDSTYVSPDKQSLQHLIARWTGDTRTQWTDYANVVNHMREVNDFVEQMTRAGVFIEARQAGYSLEEATHAARDTTTDFRRGGKSSMSYNRVTAFHNAAMAGINKFYRYHVKDLREGIVEGDEESLQRFKTASLKAGIAITVPSVLLALLHGDDEDYLELPQWERDMFWHVMKVSGEQFGKIPGGDLMFRQDPNNPQEYWVRIPKPWEEGWAFGTMPERFIEWLSGNRPDAMAELLRGFGRLMSPGILPTAMVAPLEAHANYSFFFGSPVEPYGSERLDPEYRIKRNTPESVQVLARGFNRLNEMLGGDPQDLRLPEEMLSPSRLEHILYGYGGTMGREALQLADSIGRRLGGVPPPLPLEVHDVPVLKALLGKMPSGWRAESVGEFYDEMQRLDALDKSIRRKVRYGDMGRAAELRLRHPEFTVAGLARKKRDWMAMLSAQWYRIYNDESLTPAQRQGMLAANEAMRLQFAQESLEQVRRAVQARREEAAR